MNQPKKKMGKKITRYLVLNRKLSAKVVKERPLLTDGEIAIELRINLPGHFFQTYAARPVVVITPQLKTLEDEDIAITPTKLKRKKNI